MIAAKGINRNEAELQAVSPRVRKSQPQRPRAEMAEPKSHGKLTRLVQPGWHAPGRSTKAKRENPQGRAKSAGQFALEVIHHRAVFRLRAEKDNLGIHANSDRVPRGPVKQLSAFHCLLSSV